MDTIEIIKKQIKENPILIYIKGSPTSPKCGFSARATQILMESSVKFSYVDILENPDIRTFLPKYAKWPTFPQLWVNEDLVGGSDIIEELSKSGDLEVLLNKASKEDCK